MKTKDGKVPVKGSDKGVFFFPLIIIGMLLSILGFFLKDFEITRRIFTLIVTLSFSLALITGFTDIKPNVWIFVVAILSIIVIIFSVDKIGTARTARIMRVFVSYIPKFPPDFFLFFIAFGTIPMILFTLSKKYVKENYRVNRMEIEKIVGPLGEQNTTTLRGGEAAQAEYPDILEFLLLLSGTILIGFPDKKGKISDPILRVENVLFAPFVLRRINKAFDRPEANVNIINENKDDSSESSDSPKPAKKKGFNALWIIIPAVAILIYFAIIHEGKDKKIVPAPDPIRPIEVKQTETETPK